MSVYKDETAAWREDLKLGDNYNILVAFSLYSNEDLRMARIFPEYMAGDTTFGVTKEQRNLFVVADIDGQNKVFTTMRCFRTDLRYLVTDTPLYSNQCIACDQELAIYQPLRAIMDNIPCLNKFRNRMEKYHLLTQRWNTQVIVTVSGEEIKAILKNIYQCYHLLLLPNE